MSPKYTLTYFNSRGRGEIIRVLLSYGKVQFTDKRVTHEEWAKIKDTTPIGQLPILEIDGKVLYQSISIARYLAKQFGLVGSNDWEALQIDAVVDTILDLTQQLVKLVLTKEAEAKKKLKETFLNETLPFYLSKFETLLKDNKGYLANGKLSWADIYFVFLFERIDILIPKELANQITHVQALTKTVLSLPGIKEWVAKRPEDSNTYIKDLLVL